MSVKKIPTVKHENFHEYFTINQHLFQKRLDQIRKQKINLEEEMIFCTFAANSSAQMGLLATKLLKPHLIHHDKEKYIQAVYKKVRFHTRRAEFTHHNMHIINELDIEDILNNTIQKREFIKSIFKGFGDKEASHFLRNIGHSNLAIIDKHVKNTMIELKIITKIQSQKLTYEQIEKKLKTWAKKHKYDIDELDLAIWSYKTGYILK